MQAELDQLAAVGARVARLREAGIQLNQQQRGLLDGVAAAHGHAGAGGGMDEARWAVASAANLLDYVALRREDLRDLHLPLAELGLSSLGRSEAHVRANLDAVLAAVAALQSAASAARAAAAAHPPADQPTGRPTGRPAAITMREAQALLERRAEELLGPARGGRRIMVTLPSEAASDPRLVRGLLEAGMTCARINSAHDDADAWEAMSRHVREQSREIWGGSSRACPVLIDLAGPKLRTGPIEPGPEVLRVKPLRDSLGRVLSPGVLTLRHDGDASGVGAQAPVPAEFLAQLAAGDEIELTDTRGRLRVLRVIEATASAAVATCEFTVYLASGTALRLRQPRGRVGGASIGRLPPLSQAIAVRIGDRLRLSLDGRTGRPAPVTVHAAAPSERAVLTTTLPEAFARVRAGDRVWIDDGKIGAVVAGVDPGGVDLEVTHAGPEGSRIRADKGLNLPDTPLDLPGLTARDLEVLPAAVRCAEMVGLSFVREAADVALLREALRERGGSHLGVVIKIETRRAFENLPGLLLSALHAPRAGVMIARGDLAVEIGYDRLAEVQEEILWLCEAAHLPVIWATQVLETMAKTGQPSRAEVTDAAMGERAECVMLNKGRHIVQAVRFLDDLLRRMADHQRKKRPMLRPLSVAQRFGTGA